MMSEIKIKHKYTQGVDRSYEGFSKLLVEMAYENTYDKRAAKSRGANDMDVDALAAEKAERQAELQRQDDEDEYGECQEYSPAEWLDWETQLQEELNWLGARSKDKGGKGRRKGKGKGKTGGAGGAQRKGSGKGKGDGCSWCGDPDHWRADCQKLKQHKIDMDADRKKRGLPAFVPKPRGGVHLLEVDDRHKKPQPEDNEDYEVTGLMYDSNGDCDCIEPASRENTFRNFRDFPLDSDYELFVASVRRKRS